MDMLKGMPDFFNMENITRLGERELDFLMINVPPVCNYDCEKCFTSAAKKNPEKFLSTKEVKYLIDAAEEKGIQCVCILGEGEPLLFIDKMVKEVNYREIIKHISEKNIITLIATNGLLLNRKIVDFFYENNVSIAISLDTLNSEEYKNFYRGSANLNKVIKNIEYARKIYRQDIKKINGNIIKRLCIHMTVTSKNYMNIPKIIELCGDDIYFDCEHIAQIGVANENPEIYEEYQSCIDACNSVKKAMVRTYVPQINGDACCYLYYGFAVTHDGEVLVDTHALDTKYRIGNIRDHSLNSLLKEARNLRDIYFEKYDCHYCIIRSNKYKKYVNEQIRIPMATL
ncbi:radical SAM protein [Brenneria rubrifaciens]|uniref:Radical SAM protein n=1 Tax=Brenneria rubrifaciens TaxID=55213 RepID=A0A4P8QMF6_9GAMM|nr:radical SAM protein [Brenneria rubrifaciens]QCR08131.1 radical SAM protein [Brenneria rubrifaciens]